MLGDLSSCEIVSVSCGLTLLLASSLIFFVDWQLVVWQAAKELLTSMNAPDGDCCFCMLPLDMPDSSQQSRPYMKLMSCFHCFHRFSVENFVPFLTSWFCVSNAVSYFSCKAHDSLLLQSFIIFFPFYKNFVLLHMSFPWSHAFF